MYIYSIWGAINMFALEGRLLKESLTKGNKFEKVKQGVQHMTMNSTPAALSKGPSISIHLNA